MPKAGPRKQRKWPEPLSIILARPRLFLSILTGVIVGVLLPVYSADIRGATRLLIGWDVGIALYLALAYWMNAHSGASQTQRRSFQQDEGGFAILVGTIVAAAASVGAVFSWLEAATRAETFAPRSLVFLFVTILLSWAFIHTMFALHYAHEFCSGRRKKGVGLIFPHDPKPDYWDFVYLAFSIGTSFDVAIISKRIRRTLMVQGVVSFFFNVTLIALTVGLVGDAVQN
jgi:uncharacterized membrane protein